jgi:hypothetical protein
MQIQQTQIIPTKTESVNGTTTITVDDEDEQAAFLNHCIEKETIDFEKSLEDKRNATIDGKYFLVQFHSDHDLISYR